MDQIDDNCVVCCRKILIYAVGSCDHPVCYECSTRMRVLCKQNECPICRTDLPKVIFSQKLQPYSALSEIMYPVDKKYKIYFEDNVCRKTYEKLLEHNCQICSHKTNFHTFGYLKAHMRREHELFYCDLCVTNLLIFTSERKCYTREELARHRRTGDSDDTSHRGHPLCQFCDQRYLDNDELFRHLRREHFFCHFCDADGVVNQFYSNYEYLRSHFRREHYLCEEGVCREERFVAAFRSEIDYKAHKAFQHSKNLSKAQAKQARTLELEFTIRPRNPQHNSSIAHTDGRFRHQDRYENQSKIQQVANGNERNNSPELRKDCLMTVSKSSLDTHSEEEFPCLSSSTSYVQNNNKFFNKTKNNFLNKDSSVRPLHSFKLKNKIKMTNDEFPTLQPAVIKNHSSEITVNSPKHPTTTKPQKTVLFHFNSHNNNNKNSTRHATNVSIQVAKPKKVSLSSGEDNTNIKYSKNISGSFTGEESTKLKYSTSSSSIDNSIKTNGYIKEIVHKKSLNDDFPQLCNIEQELLIPVTKNKNNNQSNYNNDRSQPYITVKCKSKKKKQKAVSVTTENEPKEIQYSEPNRKKKKEPFVLMNDSENEGNEDSLISTDSSKELNLDKINNTEFDVTEELQKQTKNLMVEDFPLLPLKIEKTVPIPPGFISPNPTSVFPPPGFKNNGNFENSVHVNSVPTINISLSSVAKQLTDDTPAKNCDKPSLLIQKQLSNYLYIEPPEFQHRNIMLIQKIQQLLKSNTDSFLEFKTLSGKFRQCQLSAKEYHQKCLEVFGKDGFMKVIPELLVLLPDISKQQELLNVHNIFCRKQAEHCGAVPKGNTWNGLEDDFQFVVCSICQQVLWSSDFQNHTAVHADVNEQTNKELNK